MPNLPSLRGREVVRAFERLGFRVVRIRGSHHVMERPGHPFVLSVPVHSGKTVKKGLLRDLIQGAGITVEEFLRLL